MRAGVGDGGSVHPRKERGGTGTGVREDCASRARRSRGEPGAEPRRSARTQRPARRPGLRPGPRGHVVRRALQPGECGPGSAPGHRCGAARSRLPSSPLLDAPASFSVAPVPGTPNLDGRESLGVPGARRTGWPPRRVPLTAAQHGPTVCPSLPVLSWARSPAEILGPKGHLSPLGAGAGHQPPPRHLTCDPISSFVDPVPGSLQC